MHKMMTAAAAALMLSATTACAQDAPPSEDHSQDAAWHNRQMLAVASLKAADGWGVLPGNVRWRRTAGNGAGAHPAVTDTVRIHYTGTFIDGTQFDTSVGGPPAEFPLDRLIKAWQVAVPMAGVGDTIEIVAPADMAYGPTTRGPIPGGATLKFTIQLLGIVPAG
ncbi:MAG: FKBP-type peptidyl-prolyl cis-trans isomerase [Pseudomonadota bacterium]